MLRLTDKPIEDPTEQTALDERLKRSEAAMANDSSLGVIMKESEALPSTPARPKARKRWRRAKKGRFRSTSVRNLKRRLSSPGKFNDSG
jgi:hypothetical protein